MCIINRSPAHTHTGGDRPAQRALCGPSSSHREREDEVLLAGETQVGAAAGDGGGLSGSALAPAARGKPQFCSECSRQLAITAVYTQCWHPARSSSAAPTSFGLSVLPETTTSPRARSNRPRLFSVGVSIVADQKERSSLFTLCACGDRWSVILEGAALFSPSRMEYRVSFSLSSRLPVRESSCRVAGSKKKDGWCSSHAFLCSFLPDRGPN